MVVVISVVQVFLSRPRDLLYSIVASISCSCDELCLIRCPRYCNFHSSRQWEKLTDASGFAWVISETEILHGLAEAVSSSKTGHHLTGTHYVRRVFLIAGSNLKTEASDT